MSRPRILVINPNSNVIVTRGLEDALKPLDFADGPEIVCATLAEGPFGIESQADVDGVAMPLRRLVESDNASAAFVIACYSDPGLHVCREGTDRPVFGIAECGVLTALTRAETFRRDRDRATLDPPACPLSAPDGTDGPAGRRAAAEHERGGNRVGRRNAREDDRGRARPEGPGWRRRDRHGLRRHGAACASRWKMRSAFP